MTTKTSKSRDFIINALESKYDRMKCRTSEDFCGAEGGIWIAADDGIKDRKGMPLFDYYDGVSYTSGKYEFGVIYHLHRWAERNGWFFEWYDCATMMMWKA